MEALIDSMHTYVLNYVLNYVSPSCVEYLVAFLYTLIPLHDGLDSTNARTKDFGDKVYSVRGGL